MKNYQKLVLCVVMIITTIIPIKTYNPIIKETDKPTATQVETVEVVTTTQSATTTTTQQSTTKTTTKKATKKATTKDPAQKEKRDVENVSKKKQEIVTKAKSKYSTHATENEIRMLAKLVYAEAGGIGSTTEQSCVIWTVLNRVDSSSYPNTIAKCITQPNQFAYHKSTKVTDHCLWLAKDVVDRWEKERAGETNVGRTLPKGYFSFWGDGKHNYFRTGCKSHSYWDYSYSSPYKT